MKELVLNWFQYDPMIVWPTAALFVVVCLQVWFYLRFLGGIYREGKRQLNTPLPETANMPGVSVIVCAHDHAEALSNNLSCLLEQDYPNYQVIVVNDASTDDTEDVLQRFESNSNFYHTFVPAGVRSISARKMAMTIGIKAAKYDYVLFVDPAAVPAGNQWLTAMMRHFDKEGDVVLGYASNTQKGGFLHRMIAFDAMFSAMTYLGLALRGKPYRSHPSNLAFRKDLFFTQKGFSSHLSLRSGDDDLLIREMATSANVRVDVSREGYVRINRDVSWSAWKNNLLNYFTTSSLYKPGIRFLLLLEGVTRFLFYVLMLYMVVMTLVGGYYAWLSTTVIFLLIRFIVQGVVINKTALQVSESRYFLLFPVFDVLIPLVKMFLRITSRSGKGNTYTWEVLR